MIVVKYGSNWPINLIVDLCHGEQTISDTKCSLDTENISWTHQVDRNQSIQKNKKT